MNKEQFLAALRARIGALPKADLERTLQYYREMIDDRVEEGMSEQEAVADVGDPAELAAAILQKPARQTAVRAPKAPKEPKARRPMSSGTKALLIAVAVILAAAGIALVIGSMNIGRMGNDVKEYTFAQNDIRALELESGAAEVKLYPATDGIYRVRCVESAALDYEVWVKEGTLHVARRSKWSLFGVSLREDYLHIYLPEREYESLWIDSSSGGVGVPADFRFRTAIVKASSGGVAFAAEVTEEMNIQTSSGGVALSGASPASLFVRASSGGVSLSDMDPGSVTLSLSSGSMRLSGVRCDELSAKSSSGSIRLSDVIAKGKLVLDCTSGSVKLDDCDAAEIRIECTSGSVSGHLLTPKVWTASSTSGSVRVPESGSGGLCVVHTTSGSIRFD